MLSERKRTGELQARAANASTSLKCNEGWLQMLKAKRLRAGQLSRARNRDAERVGRDVVKAEDAIEAGRVMRDEGDEAAHLPGF